MSGYWFWRRSWLGVLTPALRQTIVNTANFSGLTGTLTGNNAGDCASGTALGIYQIAAADLATLPLLIFTQIRATLIYVEALYE